MGPPRPQECPFGGFWHVFRRASLWHTTVTAWSVLVDARASRQPPQYHGSLRSATSGPSFFTSSGPVHLLPLPWEAECIFVRRDGLQPLCSHLCMITRTRLITVPLCSSASPSVIVRIQFPCPASSPGKLLALSCLLYLDVVAALLVSCLVLCLLGSHLVLCHLLLIHLIFVMDALLVSTLLNPGRRVGGVM